MKFTPPKDVISFNLSQEEWWIFIKRSAQRASLAHEFSTHFTASNTNIHQYSNIFIKFFTNHLMFHGGLYLFAYQIESMCKAMLGREPYYFSMTRLQRDIGIQQTQQAYGQELSNFSPNNTRSHYRIKCSIVRHVHSILC